MTLGVNCFFSLLCLWPYASWPGYGSRTLAIRKDWTRAHGQGGDSYRNRTSMQSIRCRPSASTLAALLSIQVHVHRARGCMGQTLTQRPQRDAGGILHTLGRLGLGHRNGTPLLPLMVQADRS